MNDIISIIQTYQEDNPHITITDDMIKEIVEENIDKIIKEIKEEL
jgi:hypothetical protein